MNIKKIDDTYKLFRLRFRQARKYSRIYRYYYHSDVDAKMVFIESRNGRDIAGNMLRILLEIRAQYGSEYRIITAARKESMETVKGIVSAYHLEDVKICEYESVEYFKYLWRAKYLFNDMSFPTCFIKKPEQVCTNTWPGTPLKMMGRCSASDCDKMANVQRNLLFSDYFVVPNTYYEDKMCAAYDMNGLYRLSASREAVIRTTPRRKPRSSISKFWISVCKAMKCFMSSCIILCEKAWICLDFSILWIFQPVLRLTSS